MSIKDKRKKIRKIFPKRCRRQERKRASNGRRKSLAMGGGRAGAVRNAIGERTTGVFLSLVFVTVPYSGKAQMVLFPQYHGARALSLLAWGLFTPFFFQRSQLYQAGR
ncbi:hypothetical protein TNCT_669071 [Trichonephila clavata]|uniref:Uncharacterized protein n=1 Tax=Trichonephila clavata TaxID=2740835 RepID=A0A8X6H8P3_TRICU|nr:hypothetical protein TNCT_669071 [Trichonephila clavata]